MKVTITQKEFEAICFAVDQIEYDLESATADREWVGLAKIALNQLGSLCNKFKDARWKANELNEARQYVRSKNKWMPSAQVDKIARAVIARTREDAEKARKAMRREPQ